MALEKQVVIDLIEVLEDGVIQVREATRIVEDGKVISSSFHRHVVAPDQEVDGQNDRVKAVATALWTDEVKNKYKADKSKKETPNVIG